MEDQQPDPGDLSEATAAETSEALAIDSGDDPEVPDDADEDDHAAGGDDTEQHGEQRERPLKRLYHLIRGRLAAPALAAAAALFIAAGAFAAACLQPYLAERAVAAIKMDIARTATKAIETLWNYTPENMDGLVDRAAIYLSGDLEREYRQFIDAIAPANKQAKVTDTTKVAGAAVETYDGRDATVLVYTNTTATSELDKTIPSLKYLTYRIAMRHNGNRWVITQMPAITSLDLTPRF